MERKGSLNEYLLTNEGERFFTDSTQEDDRKIQWRTHQFFGRTRALSYDVRNIDNRNRMGLVNLSHSEYSGMLNSMRIQGKMAEDASIILHDPNKKNIALFLTVMSFAMLASKAGDYMNVCTPLFEVKYGWMTQKEKDLNEALMNSIPVFGTILGCGLASYLMKSGRAQAFINACVVGIAGSILTQIEHWGVFLTAKFIVGISLGLTCVIVARFIEEYVPLKWFGISQAISLTFLQTGIFLSTIVGFNLPNEDDETGLMTNKSWRIIFAV